MSKKTNKVILFSQDMLHLVSGDVFLLSFEKFNSKGSVLGWFGEVRSLDLWVRVASTWQIKLEILSKFI